MQPDPQEMPPGEGGGDVFLEKLRGPLEYLRGLSVDEETEAQLVREASSRVERSREKLSHGEEFEARATRPGSSRHETDAEDPERARRASGLSVEGSGSLVRHLEDMLGFAPALDLPSAGVEPLPEARLGETRYTVEGELGAGGMGRVLMVYDQDIRRSVAMKMLRDDVRQDPKTLARFLEEAQATGQLEHPNIAPIYDLGRDENGKLFFTMKLVRGRNLGEIVRDISIGRLEVRRHFTLTRLVQILQQASMGVHYAHVRGVVHRDLKPENIMVGDFGEVLVMDWGLAKVSGRAEPDSVGGGDVIESSRLRSGVETVDGTIQGTLAYMSPEQARGWQDEIDERTDVYGLGAILYEMLTFRAPYEGKSAREVLERARLGEVPPPSKRAPRNRIPPSLEEICVRALAAEKEDRYESANAFHEALQIYLDGTAESERQQQEAAQLVRQGREKVAEFRRLAELESRLRNEAAEALERVEAHDAVKAKAAGWELEDEANRARQRRIRTFNEATSYLRSAIDVDSSCTPAREGLAQLYWDRFLEAERSQNVDDMTMYRGLVERYDTGRFAAQLEGKGKLNLASDPPGAEVTIYRVEERLRRQVEVDERALGATTLSLDLDMGHHLLVLKKEGFRETRCPIFVERAGRQNQKVHLYRDHEIGEGFVHVPAGEVVVGGDAAAAGALELTRRYVDDFFVSRFPVTFREYGAFLDDLASRSPGELDARLPRTEKEGSLVLRDVSGRFAPDVAKLVNAPTRDRWPEGFEWSLPVLAVSWSDAQAYCAWLSERVGRTVRLLRDIEWEKAARGVARSIHPWGEVFDWSFVKGGQSRSEPPQPEPVGAFEADVSIYGVRDLAGSIREWCADWFIDGVGRLIRGGHWAHMNQVSFRAAVRSGANPEMKSSAVGFRVAVSPGR